MVHALFLLMVLNSSSIASFHILTTLFQIHCGGKQRQKKNCLTLQILIYLNVLDVQKPNRAKAVF